MQDFIQLKKPGFSLRVWIDSAPEIYTLTDEYSVVTRECGGKEFYASKIVVEVSRMVGPMPYALLGAEAARANNDSGFTCKIGFTKEESLGRFDGALMSHVEVGLDKYFAESIRKAAEEIDADQLPCGEFNICYGATHYVGSSEMMFRHAFLFLLRLFVENPLDIRDENYLLDVWRSAVDKQ